MKLYSMYNMIKNKKINTNDLLKVLNVIKYKFIKTKFIK